MKKIIRGILSAAITAALLLGLQRLVIPKYTEGIVEGGFTAEYYRETLPHQVLMVVWSGTVNCMRISAR